MDFSAADVVPKPQNGSDHGVAPVERDDLQEVLIQENLSFELDRIHKRKIYMAAASGDWGEASTFYQIHPDWLRTPLTDRGVTVLHVAVTMEQLSFVKHLVARMNMKDLEFPMADGNTAFCLAAISGYVKIAQILFDKNPGLIWKTGKKDMLPIHFAASAGHIKMTEFLFEKGKDLHSLTFQDIVKLFFFTITNNIFTVTSKLLNAYPKLATVEKEGGLTALQILAEIKLCKENIGHQDLLSSLFTAMEEQKEPLNLEQLSKAMFDAAKSGKIMLLKFLLSYHPDLLFEVDSKEQRSLLHIAILYRQKKVYKLILKKGASINVMMELIDSEGNNILHLAGMSGQPEEKFGLSTDHVVMHNEEKWFQEVEKIVPPAMKTMRNKKELTPRQLFYQSHKKLRKESESGVKVLANTLIVVATLIITLGITGAITIPVTDIDNKSTPFFPKKIWYILFFLSIAVGIFFCAASMFFYASVILPSSWVPKDESVSLRQTKVVFGSVSLFISVGLIFLATLTGSVLIFGFLSRWGGYLICVLGALALFLHLKLDHILWSHVAISILSFCKLSLVKLVRLLWPTFAAAYHPLQNKEKAK